MGMQQPPHGLLGDATCGTGIVGSNGVVGAGPPNGIAGFGNGSYISITGDFGHGNEQSGMQSTMPFNLFNKHLLLTVSVIIFPNNFDC